MRIRIEAVALVVAATIFTVSAYAEKRDLLTEVIAAKQSARIGDPIIVSVRVTNQTSEAAVTSRAETAFDCFEVTGPDGKRLPYVGFDGQVAENPIEVRPSSAVTIAEALDLTDKYLFRKPGRYSIRFRASTRGHSDSPAITIEVAPGRLSEFDDVVAALLPVCPAGWHVVKDGRGEVKPFGRSSVPGFVLHLCHNHMHGEAVSLWFTKEEAKVDPNQPPRAKVELLGRAQGLLVYASVGDNTPPLWPKAIEEISRALQIKRQ